ncbi:MAG TPA: 2Fe-2S iron-sulfur cluster-binding protein, partial [Myxococcota bacterium]|nr:2Fe-2S iron-sulfur cluster-binding protein [Myxococcota bacterium]
MSATTIDGIDVAPFPGETILDAARRSGIEIPTLCHLPGHPPDGGCRLCLVEVEGAPRPLAACHTELRERMAVRTQTPRLDRLRAAVSELVERGRRTAARVTGHPYLRFDPGRCITCRRCVHVCEDVQGADVYALAGRGAETQLVFGADDRFETSPCTSCGACVEVCPTGALFDRDREQGLGDARTVRSTCGFCGVGCQVEIEAEPARVRQ